MRPDIFIMTLVSFSIVLGAVPARAQTTAVGPYYATPAWDQKLQCDTLATCPRFVVLSNWNSEAVLDRETGLVWERSPSATLRSWLGTMRHCSQDTRIGNRMGWRVPRLQELTSLIDPMTSFLPAGHPFSNVKNQYWSATQTFGTGGPFFFAWSVVFAGGNEIAPVLISDDAFVWCVRGGLGAEVQ